MTMHFGDVPANSTLYIPFATYGGTSGESITLTGLAVTDVEIYKNGSTTQRASDDGYTLLDTDGIDFDGLTGIHGFSVDLSDDDDEGFYAVGSWYWVVVSAVTVDSQAVNFIAATFRIVPAEAITGTPKVDMGGVSGDATAADTLELFVEALDQSTGQLDSGSLAAGTITAAAIANGAIDAATFAADVDAEFLSYLVDDATRIDASALNNLPTAAENATAILAAGDVDGFTLEETLKLCLAALAGKLSGASTTTVTIRAADDSEDRITATVDADGNRSAVTLDATG